MGTTRGPRATLVAALTCLGLVWVVLGCSPPPPGAGPAPGAEREGTSGRHHKAGPGERTREDRREQALPPGVPEKVAKVLRHIAEYDRAPKGYVGGRTFHNIGYDGKHPLPVRDPDGHPITYREWDVNPKVPGVNRGPERLVTGSDGSAYYTPDHYRTFIKIR